MVRGCRGALLFFGLAVTAIACCFKLITTHGNLKQLPRQLQRRLSETSLVLEKDRDDETKKSDRHWTWDIPNILSRAKKSSTPTHWQQQQQQPLKVLIVTTSLVEYDKGTRGTTQGFDRLKHVALPPLVDSVSSMKSRGWKVDVVLILGFKSLVPHRRQMIIDSLPEGVGLEVWEDAIPLYYTNTFNNKRPKSDQAITNGDHALSRQHRFVLRDKLQFYDFFICFEDDMRINADHVMEFLELSNDIHQLYLEALSNPNELVAVDDDGSPRPPLLHRHKPNDGATVGNDVVNDPISSEHIKRLFPGLLRVEVLDRDPNHPLRKPGVLDNHRYAKEHPKSTNAFTNNGDSLLDPKICCDENDPPRGKMTANPKMEEVIMWESKCSCSSMTHVKICHCVEIYPVHTFNNLCCFACLSHHIANIHATGVRKYPDPIGWVAAMPVEDRADVGSFWSGYTKDNPNLKRPRRVDETIGNQAGKSETFVSHHY